MPIKKKTIFRKKKTIFRKKKTIFRKKKKKQGIPKTFKTFIGMCRKIKKLFYLEKLEK